MLSTLSLLLRLKVNTKTIKTVIVISIGSICIIGIIWLYFHNPEYTQIAPKCLFLKYTGLKCPGCGVQRAIYCTLHGDFGKALQYNSLFYPTLLYMLIYLTSTLCRWIKLYNKLTSQYMIYCFMICITTYCILRNMFDF